VATSTQPSPPEAAIAIPAAEPAAAPVSQASAAVNGAPSANVPAGASSSSGVSLPATTNVSPSSGPVQSPFAMPSVPELLGILILVTLGSWLVIEMRRARPRVPGGGQKNPRV